MAFKEKKEKEILAMSKEEQIAYWQDFQSYYKEQKKAITQKLAEKEKAERQKNKTKINHARFILFGEMIKHQGIQDFIKKMSTNNGFSEKDKRDINLFLEYMNWDFRF